MMLLLDVNKDKRKAGSTIVFFKKLNSFQKIIRTNELKVYAV